MSVDVQGEMFSEWHRSGRSGGGGEGRDGEGENHSAAPGSTLCSSRACGVWPWRCVRPFGVGVSRGLNALT